MTSSVPNELPLMPTPRKGRFRGVPQAEFQVALKFVTPVLGGGVKAGFFDAVDLVRVPSVRGHLRFWWRALLPPEVDRTRMLQRERALWGGMNSNDDDGAASRVAVTVALDEKAEHVGDEPYQRGKFPAHSYASFSARDDANTPSEKQDTNPSKKFTKADGLHFMLHVSCPVEHLADVENAVRAWILFGGYGSRTRRGMGSLTVTTNRERWLPAAATRQAIAKLFGRDPFIAASAAKGDDTARLAGASLVVVKDVSPRASDVWLRALEKLREFRQGPARPARDGSYPDSVARETGAKPRPGRSKWPEADKIRHLTGRPTGHTPRFSNTPVWPRAQFGLPIVGQFVGKQRNGSSYDAPEPGDFEITWEPSEALLCGLPAADAKRLGDRLASPLIVKAMPLSDGQFVAAALWLARGFPDGMVVGEEREGGKKGWADFATIHAVGDLKPHPHRELEFKSSLRDAFLAWLVKSGFTEVTR